MTIDEQIEVMIHFKNGGKVQYLHKGHWCVVDAPIWNFADTKYRKKPEPKTRFMTAEELFGRVICDKDDHKVMIVSIEQNKDLVRVDCRGYVNPILSVSALVEDGWTLEDGLPLMVEVE